MNVGRLDDSGNVTQWELIAQFIDYWGDVEAAVCLPKTNPKGS